MGDVTYHRMPPEVLEKLAKERNYFIRDFPSQRFSACPMPLEFERFADTIIKTLEPPQKKLAGWRMTLRHCLHNLITATLLGHCIADSHHRAETPPLRIRCWDAIVEDGWAQAAKGSQFSKMVTRYIATEKLLKRRKLWKLDMLEASAGDDVPDLIVLKSGKADWLTSRPIPSQTLVSIRDRIEQTAQRDSADLRKPDPQAVQNGLDYFAGLERTIDRINRNNLKHSWTAFREIESVDGRLRRIVFQPNVALRLTYVQKLFRHGRLYTTSLMGAQSMSKEQRATILIDDERTVELDFASYHPRMLYHRCNLDPQGDLYRVEQIFPVFSSSDASADLKKEVRDFIKQATSAALNCSSRDDARGAVFGMIDELPRRVRKVIFETERSGPDDLLTRIENAHPDLMEKAKLYTDAANELMATDGMIMQWILSRMADAKLPALGVHDSLIVRRRDEPYARGVMEEVYSTFFPGHVPVIK